MSYPVRHDAGNGQLSVTVEGRRSFLQYRRNGDVLTIVHTEVPPELAGRGIGADLVRAALQMARSNGWRVRAACPYAAAFVQKHAEYADLLVQETL